MAKNFNTVFLGNSIKVLFSKHMLSSLCLFSVWLLMLQKVIVAIVFLMFFKTICVIVITTGLKQFVCYSLDNLCEESTF